MTRAASKAGNTHNIHDKAPLSPVTLNEPRPSPDEISLIDLWLVVARRRNVVFAVLALALAGSLFMAFTQPEKYAYSSALEIGAIIEDGAGGKIAVPVEHPETVLAKIRESYIPQALHRYRELNPADTRHYTINARIPKGSQLIVLEATGKEEDGPAYTAILGDIIDSVVGDHQRIVNIKRAALEDRITKARLALAALTDPSTLEVKKSALKAKILDARMKHDELQDPRTLIIPRQKLETKLAQERKALADLKDHAELLASRYQRLDETDKLLQKQIDELQAQITTSLDRRQNAIDNLRSESSAMTMLMIDNELQQNRARLAGLRERLLVTQQDRRQELEDKIAANKRQQAIQTRVIEKTRQELKKLVRENQRARKRHAPVVGELEEQLAKMLADHERAIAGQQQTIRFLETRLKNLSATHALSAPLQSMTPVGPGKKKIVILALLLALFVGIFAAFLAEFLSKARQRLAEDGTASSGTPAAGRTGHA